MKRTKVRKAGPVGVCMVVLTCAMIPPPAAQAGFFCDTALRLCEAAPPFAFGFCEKLAFDVCKSEAEGRTAEAEQKLQHQNREIQKALEKQRQS